MPLTTVAEALPYASWIVLVSLAFGSFWFMTLLGFSPDAPRGYLGFLAACAALLGALALGVDLGLPAASELAIRAAPAELDVARRLGLASFVVAAVPVVMVARRPAGPAPVGLGLLASGLVLISAAAGWAPTLVDSVPFLVQLGVLTFVTGGALAAIVLGHWYLVTPKLSERPLVLQTRWLLAAIGLQLLLFVVWTTLGGGPGQGAFQALAGGTVLLVGLRLLVSLGFPLVLTYMAMRTAQTRSMESATGLLYINLAAIMAGTIGAAALYMSSGILV